MRILVLGSSGLIGTAVAGYLERAGHSVFLTSRRAVGDGATRIVDFARPEEAAFRRALEGMDVIVNCIGIFRQAGDQTFDAIHVKGPALLFGLAQASGVQGIVHLSALGADPDSPIAYFSSKGLADAQLLSLPLRAWVVRPSLVFSPQGASTRFFAGLAALPLTPLPGSGSQQVQPIHLQDLAEAIAVLVQEPGDGGMVLAVGPCPLTLKSYLSMFKHHLRLGGAFVTVPSGLSRLAFQLLARVPGSRSNPDALAMLEQGSTASTSSISAVLGRAPVPPERFFAALGPGMRIASRLAWLLPCMRIALAAMWLVTAWVSVFVYPLEASLRLLGRVGLDGWLALFALHGAAVLDAWLGVATLFARRRRRVYQAQLIVILAYTVVITIWLPEYWAHPYGPILKNLPLMAMILSLLYLDGDNGPGSR